MITIIEKTTPLKLPNFLWHGTKYIAHIAKDDFTMKVNAFGNSQFIEGIRFTTDPRNLKNYAVYPFWIKVSTRGLKPVDFIHRSSDDYHYREEDEYAYIKSNTLPLKGKITAIYVHEKVEKDVKRGWYKPLVEKAEQYKIDLIYSETWLWR